MASALPKGKFIIVDWPSSVPIGHRYDNHDFWGVLWDGGEPIQKLLHPNDE